MKSSTSTGYFSNSTGSSVTNHRFFPDIVVIFRVFFFINVKVYSIYSSKMAGKFPQVSIFNWLFLKLNQFVCN